MNPSELRKLADETEGDMPWTNAYKVEECYEALRQSAESGRHEASISLAYALSGIFGIPITDFFSTEIESLKERLIDAANANSRIAALQDEINKIRTRKYK